MSALRPPYCATCDKGVPANHITVDQRHDPAAGGCGGAVVPLPDLPGGATAIGVYAKMGERWVLQWPLNRSVKSAKSTAARFSPGTELELRPLFDGPPLEHIPYLERIDLLMSLNATLAGLLANSKDGIQQLLDELAELREDAARLDKLEQLANKPEGLQLHPGIQVPRHSPGLGLSAIGRTLRQAVDHLRRAEMPPCRIELYNAGQASPKTCARCGLGQCQAGATYLKDPTE